MNVALIVAFSSNHVIGAGTEIPWHISNDLKRFKKITSGHSLIMGRKTYESIGKPLPNRTTVIISRNPSYRVEGCITVSSLGDAIKDCRARNEERAFIAGGGEIYRLALEQDLVDLMHITAVHRDFEGDVFFPDIDYTGWKELSRDIIEDDPAVDFAYSFVDFERVR